MSSRSMEEVAQSAGEVAESPRWFQLCWGKNPDLTASMVQRAERARYSALVVTLDTHSLGWRERDLGHGYLPFMLGQGLANYFSDAVFRGLLAQAPEENPAAAIQLWGSLFSNATLTWKDIVFLRQHTRVAIIVKRILHREDAALAVDAGVDALIVSNHRGRQVDGGVGALDALPGVVHEVNGRVPVMFDSGIRRGADAFMALVLGARAVLVGRLYLCGVAGTKGIGKVSQVRGARQGVASEEMQFVAKREGLAMERMPSERARGRCIIPANIHHRNLEPMAIGIATKCKINANIGNSATI